MFLVTKWLKNFNMAFCDLLILSMLMYMVFLLFGKEVQFLPSDSDNTNV